MKFFDWFVLIGFVSFLLLAGFVLLSLSCGIIAELGIWDIRALAIAGGLLCCYYQLVKEIWLVGTGKKEL